MSKMEEWGLTKTGIVWRLILLAMVAMILLSGTDTVIGEWLRSTP